MTDRSVVRVAAGVILVLAVASCTDATGPEGAPDPASISVSAPALQATVEALADDSMCGRLTKTRYEAQAADYVADAFAAAGLEAAGTDGWFQPVSAGLAHDVPAATTTCAAELLPTSRNVLGALAGRGGLGGEWVIVGAHYDHLGWTAEGDFAVVFNGADDNASGTAVVIEAARMLSRWLAAHPDAAPAYRSIMFQAYGAEESGLFGSRVFATNPTVPGDSLYAMVNLDMVGRLRENRLIVEGTGTWGAWATLLEDARPGTLQYVFNDDALERSDQYSFIMFRELPAIHLFTGLHAQYHTAADDAELLNYTGMQQIAQLVLALVWELATRGAGP